MWQHRTNGMGASGKVRISFCYGAMRVVVTGQLERFSYRNAVASFTTDQLARLHLTMTDLQSDLFTKGRRVYLQVEHSNEHAAPAEVEATLINSRHNDSSLTLEFEVAPNHIELDSFGSAETNFAKEVEYEKGLFDFGSSMPFEPRPSGNFRI